MVDFSMADRIPQALKDAPIWTFTNTDYDPNKGKHKKIPMDPLALDLGSYQGIATTDHLVTFDMLQQVRNVPDTWLPAFNLSARNNGWVMVDIEPAGMQPDNPYFNIAYAYVEASRHDGFHGLIQLDTDYDFMKKTVVKLHTIETEVLLNHHFVTLTGKPASNLYQPTVTDTKLIAEGLQQSASQSVEINEDNLINTSLKDMNMPLSDNAQWLFNRLKLTPLKMPEHVDKSEWEFSVLRQNFNLLYKYHYTAMSHLTDEDKTALLYKAAQIVLPFRNKHTKMFNDSHHGDRVNYLFYMVRKIVEYG